MRIIQSIITKMSTYHRWDKVSLQINLEIVLGLFHNCRLGCLLPRYSPMVLGRRVKTSLTATHPKPVCAQTKAPLLKLWLHAHGRGNYYKGVMAGRYNIITIKGKCLLSARKQEIPNHDFNKGGDNAVI